MTKTLRLFLQSAMLGLGAYLVLQNELTAGAMIAGSILLGRALAPIEMAIGQWALVTRAHKGWHSLAELLGEVPPETERTPLPAPKARLSAQNLTVIPPRSTTGRVKGGIFRHRTRHHRWCCGAIWCRQIHTGPRDDGCLAPSGW
jgi:ATP-binding cassette subfamily C protein